MAFMAAAIPIAASVIGAMSKEEAPPQGPAIPPPPSLGEIIKMNGQNAPAGNYAMPELGQFNAAPVGGGAKRF